jgi:hypothetical protein
MLNGEFFRKNIELSIKVCFAEIDPYVLKIKNVIVNPALRFVTV